MFGRKRPALEVHKVIWGPVVYLIALRSSERQRNERNLLAMACLMEYQ
jgi:hypothetical protein